MEAEEKKDKEYFFTSPHHPIPCLRLIRPCAQAEAIARDKFTVLLKLDKDERKPRNEYDMILWHCPPGTIPMEEEDVVGAGTTSSSTTTQDGSSRERGGGSLKGVVGHTTAAEWDAGEEERRDQRRSTGPTRRHDFVTATTTPSDEPVLFSRIHTQMMTSVPQQQQYLSPYTFYLENLLSPAEAKLLVHTAEAVGMIPDNPLTSTEGDSILSHHFVWMDHFHLPGSFIRTVFERCRRFLPAEIHGARLHSLNGRLRFYRYTPGGIYRPHVDGAWPLSGVVPRKDRTQQQPPHKQQQCGVQHPHHHGGFPSTDEYEYAYDVSDGRVSSKLTCLIYLNEGFEGGETTYFTPAYEDGWLWCTRVVPRIGGCMIFPHADTAGALVHEGSSVRAGTKYIIRTEVLYEKMKN